MQIDISPRAGGKTTRLLEWVAKDPKRVLITFSKNEAERLRGYIQSPLNRNDLIKQINPEQIQTWNEYIQKQGRGAEITEVGIDNVDIILQNQVKHRITKISITEI